MRIVKRAVRALIPLTGAVLFLAGCNGGPSDTDNPEHQKMLGMSEDQKRQSQIDEIKNNPKMPDFAKQMAIANLSRNHK